MRFLIILLLFCGFYTGFAQESPLNESFKASLVGGINLSQLDEDGLSGFRKPGIRVGFTIERSLSANKGLSIGILYDERGSNGKLGAMQTNSRISMKYITIPLSYSIGSWWFEPLNRHKLQFSIRFIPARLIHTYSSHPEFNEKMGSFKNWDYSVGIQLSYAVGQQGSVQLILNRSINRVFKSLLGASILKHYLMGVQIGYSLNKMI